MSEASAHSVKDEVDSDYRKKHGEEKKKRDSEGAKQTSLLTVFVRDRTENSLTAVPVLML